MPFTFTQLQTDNFTRANETPLSNGGAWTAQALTSAVNLASNNAVATSTSNIGRVVWTNITWPTDHYSQSTIGAGFTSTSFFDCIARSLTGVDTCYRVDLTPTSYLISKLVNAANTNLKSGAGTFAANDVIILAVSGSTINFYQNGSLVDTATDAALTTGGPGFGLADTAVASNAKVSNWVGGAVNATSTAASGTPQSAAVTTQFTNPLVVNVKDSSGANLPGVLVTFAAPGSGASGTFAGGVTTATTDASGNATSVAFTANAVGGSYVVTGTANGLPAVNFNLTNTSVGGSTVNFVSRHRRFINKRG